MDEKPRAEARPPGLGLDPARVFEEHFDAIVRYVARRLERDDVEDAVGEVFVRALAGATSYVQEYDSARPWLYGIAAHVIADRRRSEARRLRALHRLARHRSAPDTNGLEVSEGQAPQLVEALQRLKRPDRETLLLVAWGELTYEETAVALGIPVGTVRSRMARARRQVGAVLQGSGAEVVSSTTKEARHAR